MLHRVVFVLGLFTASLSMMVGAMVIGNLAANEGRLADPGLAILFLLMLTGGIVVTLLAQRSRRRVLNQLRAAAAVMMTNSGYVDASVMAMVLRCSLDDAVALLDDWAEREHMQRRQLRGYDVRYTPKQ
jgi:hypothetical protein